MNLEDTNIFTGIPEMDTHTLHQLDNKTLFNIAQVNQYAYELCMNDLILRQRIKTHLNSPLVQTVINPLTGRLIRTDRPAYRQLMNRPRF